MEIDLDEPTRPQLAAVFGVSSRWIGELRSKNDLPPHGSSLLKTSRLGAFVISRIQVDLDAGVTTLEVFG